MEYKHDAMVVGLVAQGSRPSRPDAKVIGLSDPVWRLAEDCWAQKRKERPSISEVLTRLKRALASWMQPDQEAIPFEPKREKDLESGGGFVEVGIPIG